MRAFGSILVIILFAAGPAFGQEQYGNIRGVVVDSDGDPLAGTTVFLESAEVGSRSLVCTEAGIFRFINLTPGPYGLRCELPGFKAHVHKTIVIQAGTNFDLRITLTAATLEKQITVVARSPIVDTKKTGTATNVSQEMLQNLPSARDPWVILQQAPGILVSQENVGGSASGIQGIPVGRAGLFQNTQYSMDGVPTTDLSTLGASPMYYDFDTFEEMTVVTGGQDAAIQTGGLSINIITKRGRNQFQVQARTFFTNGDLQGDNRTPELRDLGYVGDRINQFMDYGIQVGGPVKKNRLWFWLGYGVQDIRRLTIAGYPTHTKLEGINAKLNFHLGRNDRIELAFIDNAKTVWGRGAGPTRPPETTLDQTGSSPYFKFEGEHTFSPNFLLSLKTSYMRSAFDLIPRGGMGTQIGYDLATGVYSSSYPFSLNKLPSFVASLMGIIFKERFMGGNHELRLGAEYRWFRSQMIAGYSGGAGKMFMKGRPLFASVFRDGNTDCVSHRLSLFANEAWTIGRLTLNLALRLDREDEWNKDAPVPASMVAPGLLPAVTYPGYDPEVLFLTFSPRFGFTYDLTGDGKTIVRGNVARYGSQQGTTLAYSLSSSSYAEARYLWKDLNGDNLVSTNELVGYPTAGLIYYYGFDPWNPTNFQSLNGADKNLKTQLTDELLLGIEREVFADFSLGGTFILRRNHRVMDTAYYDKASGKIIRLSDYIGPVKGSLTYEGTTYNYEYWTLASRKPVGLYTLNVPDYSENFTALEFTAVKRLSRKWMMNASFTYQIYNIENSHMSYFDPTNTAMTEGARYWLVSNSDWMAKLSFLYQLPWGFNFSGFANIRQGFINLQQIVAPTPARGAVGLGSTMEIYIEKPGETRLPDFYNVDLSLTKDIRLRNYGRLTLCLDAFNVFNLARALSRYPTVNSPRHDEIQQILNPRVIRLGVRYNF